MLPSAMVLVSIWSLYLGAMAVFQPMESTTEDSDSKSTQHSDAIGHNGDSIARSVSRSSEEDEAKSASRGDSQNSQNGKGQGVSSTGSSASKGKVMVKPLSKSKLVSHPSNRLATKLGRTPTKVKTSSAEAKAKVALRDSIINEAVALALDSEKPSENLIAVAMEQYRRGEKDDARAILLMAEKMAADPDDQIASSKAVRAVVKAMLAQRQAEDAMFALQNIQNVREREQAIAEVAAWSARLGEVDAARNLIIQIVNARDRDVALVAIAESEAAYEGVAVAMLTVTTIANERKKDDAYRRIAIKRGALKDFPGAEQAIQLIKSDKLKDSTFTSLARQRARGGDVAGGLQALQSVHDQSMADISLRELATELARSGRFSTSAYVTSQIRGERERSYALESLSVEQARAGDLSGSLVRTDSIQIDSVRERTLKSVSSVTADKGSPAQARNVAIRITSGKERDRAYRAIAQAAAADGDHVTAYNTLQDINRSDEKALALVSMARTRQRQGDNRQALAMLEDASRESREVRSANTVDRIQSDMAVAYAERQESGHSLLLADNIQNQRRRDTTYGSLARTLAGSDIYAAQQSVLSISSNELRITAEDAVARTHAKNVSPQDAVNSARALTPGRQQIVFLLEVSRKT